MIKNTTTLAKNTSQENPFLKYNLFPLHWKNMESLKFEKEVVCMPRKKGVAKHPSSVKFSIYKNKLPLS